MISVNFTEDDFNKKVQEFVEISKSLHDTWNIIEKESKIYMTKRQTISIPIEQAEIQVNDEDRAAIRQTAEEIYLIEYHVVFHPSYQVPVLYFNAHRDDGKAANLEDISIIFIDESDSSHNKEIHKIISQADHPILFKPFYMIHPCHIHEVLSKFPESKNFILTFLSIFGPSIRLKMNSEYEKFYID